MLHFFKLILSLCILFSNDCYASAIRVIYTNDWQSNLDNAPMALSNLDEIRKASPYPTVVLDGGDTLMGSLYHTIAEETGGGFTLMRDLNFDATTLGNHEFDFGPATLLKILDKVKSSLPIIASNLILDSQLLVPLKKNGSLQNYRIVSKKGVRIGVIGLMGLQAQTHIQPSEHFHFSDPVLCAQENVALLQSKNVDYIIALSHGGITKDRHNNWTGDDVQLAQVEGIDLIVGGHSHTALHQPLHINNTWIVQAGSHLDYIGHIDIAQDRTLLSGKLHKTPSELSSTLIAMKISKQLQSWRSSVNSRLQKDIAMTWETPISPAPTFASPRHTRFAVTEALRQYAETDFAMIGAGEIYPQEDIKKWDVGTTFKLLPLGQGLIDPSPGSSILKVWLYGSEILNLLETMMFLSDFKDSDFYPIFTGADLQVNTLRPYFFRIEPAKGAISPDKLYSLATTSFGGSYLWKIRSKSYGLLNITPKDSGGNSSHQLKDHAFQTPSGSEIKAWTSIAPWFSKNKEKKTTNINHHSDLGGAFAFYTFPLILLVLILLSLLRFIRKNFNSQVTQFFKKQQR